MKSITFVLVAFSNAEKLTDYCSKKDTELIQGSNGFIDSLSRENIACPSWYQSWQGYEVRIDGKLNEGVNERCQ
jgi:hypothetical protein